MCRLLACTKRELFERMDEEELLEWMAEYQLSPWGQDRSELANAIGYSAICASMGVDIKPEKLIHKWDNPPLTTEQQERKARFEAEILSAELAGLKLRQERMNQR